MEVVYAPIHAFLPYLVDGWRFVGDVAEPMPAHHGRFATMMERDNA